ncbi:polysaccharide pyruvyl transferase family protein [Spongiibacter tropicus]|uniref:polysaccharide pyruvyl transferase family protein n=1 Tax=Spongiibacter tropicus TaxID=454602 RepID=UPI000A031ED7|nr:polysaccharide pyruvyl transferase family protein [Spongiibacter tropicus]
MKNKALIVDYWSDYNRGDAMMQVAILQLVDQWPSVVALDSGINEYKEFSKQLDESKAIGPIEFTPSPKLSLYFRKSGKLSNLANKLIMVANVLVFHFIMLMWKLRIKFLIPNGARKLLGEISASEVIIWNGRNFRGNKKLFEFFEFFDLCTCAIASIYMKKKVYALGVSVWEPKSVAGSWLLRKIFSRCERVYAREDVSLQLLEKNIMSGSKEKLKYLPDLSFFYMKKNIAEESDLRDSSIFTIGVVPKDPVKRNGISLDNYSKFVSNLAAEVAGSIGNGRKVRFKFINQAVLENEPNDEAIELIGKKLSSLGEVIGPKSNPSLEDLSIAYRECDFVISSRMHGCILSSYLGRPFIGIPYDRGAKWGILERLGDCVLLPMEEIEKKQHPTSQLIEKSLRYAPRAEMDREADEIVSIVNGITGKD